MELYTKSYGNSRVDDHLLEMRAGEIKKLTGDRDREGVISEPQCK